MVRLVDVAPTIAEIAGATLEGQPIPIVGRSFVELLTNPESGWSINEAFAQRRPADEKRLNEGWIDGQVYATRNHQRSVFVNSEAENEFYDLVHDPFELENIFDPNDPEMAEIVRGLTESFEFMGTQGESLQSGVASPEIIEELKALGYL